MDRPSSVLPLSLRSTTLRPHVAAPSLGTGLGFTPQTHPRDRPQHLTGACPEPQLKKGLMMSTASTNKDILLVPGVSHSSWRPQPLATPTGHWYPAVPGQSLWAWMWGCRDNGSCLLQGHRPPQVPSTKGVLPKRVPRYACQASWLPLTPSELLLGTGLASRAVPLSGGRGGRQHFSNVCDIVQKGLLL